MKYVPKETTVQPVISVVLYIRVSTEEQAREGYSLEAQLNRLLHYSKEKGYKVVGTYIDEGKSARSKLNSRKELLKLLNDAKEKKFNRIIFWRIDRWFRSVKEYYKTQEILDTHSIDWECSDEDYNTTTTNGRLFLNIKLSIAENESDQTGDRIKFNFENMVQQGRPISGAFPMGYKINGEKKNKKVVKDPETMHIIEDMFTYYAENKIGSQTAFYLQDKYRINITPITLLKYLKNELYTGHFRGNDNYCEPYITKEQYNINLVNIARNVKQCTVRYDYIFSGLIKCPKCHRRLAGTHHYAYKDKTKYKSRGYRCNYGHNYKTCEFRSVIIENNLEKYLIENLKEILKKYIIKTEDIKEKNNTKDIDGQKQALINKLERLNELYIDGHLIKGDFENKFKTLSEQLHKLSTKENIIIDLKKYKTLLEKDITEIYACLNNKSKRAFWAEYIDYISRDENGDYEVHFLNV